MNEHIKSNTATSHADIQTSSECKYSGENSDVIEIQPETRCVHSNDTEIPTPLSLQSRYEFIREIGHGAQGKLFLARRLEGCK